MKRFEIDAKLTELVSFYIQQGYTINTMSMTGHQGEDGKVDLVKDNELIRIWLDKKNDYKWSDRNAFHGYTMYLKVGRWNYPADRIRDSFSTAWMKDFSVFQEMKFYEISSGWYIEDLQEAINIQNIREKRYLMRSSNVTEEKDFPNATDIAIKHMKRVRGYQRISRQDVSVVKVSYHDEARPYYYIHYKSNSFRMR